MHLLVNCLVVYRLIRATAVPAGLLWRVLAMGILSVRLSVCLSVRPSVTTRYGFKAR